MANPAIKVKKLHPKAKIPTKAYRFDAGFDLYAVEDKLIPPGKTILIDTGIAMEIPQGYVGLIWDRSSLGSKGIHRHCGVIDSPFRNSIKVALSNTNLDNNNREYYHIKAGNKIAQILIQEIPMFDMIETEKLSDSDRGDRGFGSSGK